MKQLEISNRLVESVADIQNKTRESGNASSELTSVSEKLSQLASVLESIANQLKG